MRHSHSRQKAILNAVSECAELQNRNLVRSGQLRHTLIAARITGIMIPKLKMNPAMGALPSKKRLSRGSKWRLSMCLT
jgi:hypothetical protein